MPKWRNCAEGIPLGVDLPAPVGRRAKFMYTVYAIKSKIRNYIYVGLTSNLNERLNRHNSGYEKTTRAYAPFNLIFSEDFQSRVEARTKEKYFKSGVGKEFLKKIK